MKITKELQSDLTHLAANVDYLTFVEVGTLMVAVLRREKEKLLAKRRKIPIKSGNLNYSNQGKNGSYRRGI